MKNWQTVHLEDIASLVTKGTTPTTFGKQFTDEGVNFIKAEAWAATAAWIQAVLRSSTRRRTRRYVDPCCKNQTFS